MTTSAATTVTCVRHIKEQWKQARDAGTGKAAFLLAAPQLAPADVTGQRLYRICPDRPATDVTRLLCRRHKYSWIYRTKTHGVAPDYNHWLSEQYLGEPHWDCGEEMAQHVPLRIDTGIEVDFADPHSPW